MTAGPGSGADHLVRSTVEFQAITGAHIRRIEHPKNACEAAGFPEVLAEAVVQVQAGGRLVDAAGDGGYECGVDVAEPIGLTTPVNLNRDPIGYMHRPVTPSKTMEMLAATTTCGWC